MKRSRTSAGLLLFRRTNRELEVLLAHPGGPFFRRQDEGVWTIPKGEAAAGEDLRRRAQIEFEEEVGMTPLLSPWIDVGSIIQKGGKVVHGWAVEWDLPEGFVHRSNTFQQEWPPHSGKVQTFPEIDRVAFFSITDAQRKLKAAQLPFLERLVHALEAQ